MKNLKLLLFFMSISVLFVLGCESNEVNILDLNLKEHNNLAIHIHPILQIEIMGEDYPLPANEGVSEDRMRVIHTHDDTGKLHVEGPYAYDFKLKDWFTIWGETFNASCIIEYCENDTHALTMYINGLENEQYDEILLEDGMRIKIVFGEKIAE